jgi:hypothetical protein
LAKIVLFGHRFCEKITFPHNTYFKNGYNVDRYIFDKMNFYAGTFIASFSDKGCGKK